MMHLKTSAVKWVWDYELKEEGCFPTKSTYAGHNKPIAVIAISKVKAWLKEEFRCDCGRGLFGEPHLVWCKHRIYERLIVQLEDNP